MLYLTVMFSTEVEPFDLFFYACFVTSVFSMYGLCYGNVFKGSCTRLNYFCITAF